MNKHIRTKTDRCLYCVTYAGGEIRDFFMWTTRERKAADKKPEFAAAQISGLGYPNDFLKDNYYKVATE